VRSAPRHRRTVLTSWFVLILGLVVTAIVVGCQPPASSPAPSGTQPPAATAVPTAVPAVVTVVPTYVTIAPAGIPAVVGDGALAVVPPGDPSAIAPVTANLGAGWTATVFVRPEPGRSLAVRLQAVPRPNRAVSPSDPAVAVELEMFDATTGERLNDRSIAMGVRGPSGVRSARIAPFMVHGVEEQPLTWSVQADSDAILFQATAGSTIVVASARPDSAVIGGPGAPTATSVASTSTVPLMRAPLPSRMAIPAIGVDAAIVPVGLEPDGIMASPPDGHLIGWYEPGPRPGEPSNAVLDGHVDWSGQAAVFWRLHDLQPGDEIFVRSGVDLRFRFVVTDIRQYRADAAPVSEIFGPTTTPVLTLITCGGEFNHDRHEYEERIVVRAKGA
jgi:sortase (surface protein transpeptidase)